MKKISFLLLAFQCIVLSVFAQVKLDHLKTENLTNPIGLDVLQPYFSWQLISNQRNVQQSAYEIRVGTRSGSISKRRRHLEEWKDQFRSIDSCALQRCSIDIG